MSGKNDDKRSTNTVTNTSNDVITELAEFVRCLICMEKVVDVRMCPKCAKLFCLACIRRWLIDQSKSKCPHCCATLQLNELLKCPWVEEMAEKVETIEQRTPGSDIDRCSTHENDLDIYCSTCRVWICKICALWGTHIGHEVQQLEDKYEQYVSPINNEADRLKQRLIETKSLLQDLERHRKSLQSTQEERVREARNAVDLTIACLESALESKLHVLKDHEKSVTQEMDHLTRLIQDIEHRLKTCSKSEIVRKANGILKMIHDRKPMASFAIAPDPVDFHSEIVPGYTTVEFTISYFTALQHEGMPVDSPRLNGNGLCWKVKVFPDGCGAGKGKCLAMFLELVAGHPGTSKYDCKLEMVHPVASDPSKNVVVETTYAFEVGERWGRIDFFRLDALASEGYLDPESDTLKLRYHVRHPTYYQRCKDQQWYIDQLLNIQNQLQHRLRICEISRASRTDAQVGQQQASAADSDSDF